MPLSPADLSLTNEALKKTSTRIFSTTPKKRRQRRKLLPGRRRKGGQRKALTDEALAHTINEFAARANVSRPTIYRMMKDGELRFIRLRGRRLIPVSEYSKLGF
jgi:excisionase family DNA binding protein